MPESKVLCPHDAEKVGKVLGEVRRRDGPATNSHLLAPVRWVGPDLGSRSRPLRKAAEDDSAPECRSEKSLEVSSPSLESSVISRVARLHNSNPTNVARMSFARITRP